MFINNGGPHEIKLERRLNSPYSYGISICKITQIFKRFYISKACTQKIKINQEEAFIKLLNH